MYFDFYQLRKAPFNLTPDPEFLFLSPSHQQAFGAILYGISERKGLVVVTGEVGLGKTTLLRAALEQVDTQRLKVISVFHTNVSFTSLVKLLARELRVDFFPDDLEETIIRLKAVLGEEDAQGRTVVLIIDEAQNLPMRTLLELRLFLNIETETAKLLQIVLVGQPELMHKLDLPELRALKQCVAIRETLSPMTAPESVEYIEHRLAKVALDQEPIFTPKALQHIVAHAGGVPRLLNILCDNVLISGFADQERPISAKLAKEVLADLEKNPEAEGSPVSLRRGRFFVLQSKQFRWGLAGAFLVLLVGGVYWNLDFDAIKKSVEQLFGTVPQRVLSQERDKEDLSDQIPTPKRVEEPSVAPHGEEQGFQVLPQVWLETLPVQSPAKSEQEQSSTQAPTSLTRTAPTPAPSNFSQAAKALPSTAPSPTETNTAVAASRTFPVIRVVKVWRFAESNDCERLWEIVQ